MSLQPRVEMAPLNNTANGQKNPLDIDIGGGNTADIIQ